MNDKSLAQEYFMECMDMTSLGLCGYTCPVYQAGLCSFPDGGEKIKDPTEQTTEDDYNRAMGIL